MPIKKNKVSFNLDLEEQIKKVKPSKRKEVTELIGVTVLDSIVNYLDRSTSPVSKGQFKKTLSKAYKKATGKTKSDLQLTNSMLENLTFTNTKKGVEFKITDRKQKLKSFNHNKGDTLPIRQFLPDDTNSETFKPSIIKKVKEIISDASED